MVSVIPVKTGIQEEPRQRRHESYGSPTRALDSRFRGNDGQRVDFSAIMVPPYWGVSSPLAPFTPY